MQGIFFNEDPNHFLFSRAANGYEEITIQDNIDFIRQYKGSNITDFLICLNASLPYFKTDRLESAYDKYKRWEKEGKLKNTENSPQANLLKFTKLFCQMYDSGFDYRQIWIDELNKIGIHPWISFRTNDIHDSNLEDAFLPSSFYNSHRNLQTGAYKGDKRNYYEHALDYSNVQVRQYYLSLIGEALDKYDIYGIELDFMREIYAFPKGMEYTGKEYINEFLHLVNALVWQKERERGHKIKIAIRIPDSIDKCMRLGYDVISFIQSGWVDHITISPRWSSSDSDMNIETWISLLKTTNITLATAIEILCDPCAKPDRKYIPNTSETVYGTSYAYSCLGSNYIYLFNYMDSVGNEPSTSLFNKDNYKEFLSTLGNDQLMKNKLRRCVVTRNDVLTPGYPNVRRLPMSLNENEFGDFRLPIGDNFGKELTFIVGLTSDDANEIYAYLNTQKFTLTKAKKSIKSPAYPNLAYYTCSFTSSFNTPIVIGEIFSNSKITVEWVEIEIK